MSEPITTYLTFAPHAVQLTLVEHGLYVDRKTPEPFVVARIEARVGERVLCTCEYGLDDSRVLLDGPYFRAPVVLGFQADRIIGAERGLLCIDLCAAPTSAEQEAVLLDLERSGGDRIRPWRLPNDDERRACPLGRVWLPAGPDMLGPIDIDTPTVMQDLQAFENGVKPFIDRILYGDPSEEAARLLRSVPGIGSELAVEEA